MDESNNDRPAKRAKIENGDKNLDSNSRPSQTSKRWARKAEYKRQQRRAELNHPQPESAEHRRDRQLFGIDEDDSAEIGLKPLQDEARDKLKKLHMPKMFHQPSVITVGDKGIFVTSDKGREKKCLSDLADLVEEYLEQHNLIPAELVDPVALVSSRLERQQQKTATVHVDNEDSPEEDEEIDIESGINAELSAMQSSHGKDTSRHPAKGAPIVVRAFQLITLDIPCVSFLRFIPKSFAFNKVNVAEMVHSICLEAALNPGRMRSRYIKRLSPITWLGKVLNSGLAQAVEEVLPDSFEIERSENEAREDDGSGSNASKNSRREVTFAIKSTIRNNDKISRDELIKEVAEQVQRLGGGKHKVDLKNYQKGILVEIYRGWIGMSVVDNTSHLEHKSDQDSASDHKLGYEALKRFNLSEIYGQGLHAVNVKADSK